MIGVGTLLLVEVAGSGPLDQSGLSRTCDAAGPQVVAGWRRYPRWVVEFAVLGPLEVRAAPTGDVPIRRGLPRTLLIALLLRPGQTVSSDALIDLLWSDADLPRNPANALQIQVSYLRKTLANAEPDGAGLLVTRAGGYALAVERDAVDAHRFEAITRAFTDLSTSGIDRGAARGPRRGGCRARAVAGHCVGGRRG